MFINVLTQVVILFVLIFIGFLFAKFKILDDKSVSGMTEIVLILVTPCVIVKSFFRQFKSDDLNNLLLSFLLGVLIHIGFIILSLVLRDKDKNRQKVLQFSVIFSNSGFMALPLQEALLGENGVFLGSSFVAIFNAFVWSYGVFIMSGDKKTLKPLKIITRPAILALIIGFLIFIFSVSVPKVISAPISYIAALNTPLPMIIIGYHLSKSNVLKGLLNLKCVFAMLLRLVVFPVIAIALMWLCGIKGDMLISLSIGSCAPVAALTTMFSAKYNRDTEMSVNMVSLTTLFSIITMPLVISFADLLLKL